MHRDLKGEYFLPQTHSLLALSAHSNLDIWPARRLSALSLHIESSQGARVTEALSARPGRRRGAPAGSSASRWTPPRWSPPAGRACGRAARARSRCPPRASRGKSGCDGIPRCSARGARPRSSLGGPSSPAHREAQTAAAMAAVGACV
eukprot:3051748-Pleurochrysis_carterae.AAC.1